MSTTASGQWEGVPGRRRRTTTTTKKKKKEKNCLPQTSINVARHDEI